jgi:membrane protease YdiL (CAAX protease family)
MEASERQTALGPLVLLTLLPLAVIGLQLALQLEGIVGYSLYKLMFLIPPWLYCRRHTIRLGADILRFQHWRRGLAVALGLGTLAVIIFWGVYYWLGDLLLDKPMIAEKIGRQFSVTSRTVLLVAPVTIFLNSFLEEFFYRGFAFGLLVQRHRQLGYWLPAIAFTLQHVLFIYHWVTALPFALAVIGLLIFALVLEKAYEATQSIVAPWVIHILGDVAMMGIAVTLLR